MTSTIPGSFLINSSASVARWYSVFTGVSQRRLFAFSHWPGRTSRDGQGQRAPTFPGESGGWDEAPLGVGGWRRGGTWCQHGVHRDCASATCAIQPTYPTVIGSVGDPGDQAHYSDSPGKPDI